MSHKHQSTAKQSTVSHPAVVREGRPRAAAAAAAGAFGVAPAILRADDKAKAKKLIVGTAAHTYEVIDDWASARPTRRSATRTWSRRSPTAASSSTTPARSRSTSTTQTASSSPPSASGGAADAHGMDLRKEGNDEFLYLAPTGQHKVFKIDLKGEVVMELDYPKDAKDRDGKPCYPNANKYVPTFIAFARRRGGRLLRHRRLRRGFIHRYNGKGEYQSTFGGKGNADDQTACPHGIYCDTRDPANPRLVVADREHHRLQFFTLDGKLESC